MKKISVVFSLVAFCLCANLLAISVRDSLSYKRNGNTSFIIRNASGSLEVKERRTDEKLGAGYVIEIKYDLDILLKGKQAGEIVVFLPDAIFADNFYQGLKGKKESFGAFTIKYDNTVDACDASGKTYENCEVVNASDIDHNYNSSMGQAKVLSMSHKGPIQWVEGLEIKLTTHSDMSILGAVQFEVSGVSNNGIGFTIGMDAMPN